MKTYLKLRLNRVDFVDKGANPGAHITLAKRAPTEDRPMADTKEAEAVAKRLADLDAENIELAKRLAVAEATAATNAATAQEQAETVAKLLEDRAKDAALSVAKGLDKLGKVEETAHLLFVAKRKLDAEDYAQLERTFTALNAQIKASKLFGVTGVESDGDSASDLDRLVSKRMAEQGEAQHIAFAEVIKTTEGKAAYSAVRGH